MLRWAFQRANRSQLSNLTISSRKSKFAFSSTMSVSSGSDWRRVIPKDATIPPYSVFTKAIEKSPRDDREYRMIQLQNGLKATLIYDSEADISAASLSVESGHLSDPLDMPGLAHFCEHLLFMGTEQFPRENEYQEYLSKNNGSSNAYTSSSNTCYYFSVATSALTGGLERFSGFFHSPLFSPSCTSRELNAVDSENKKNHQQDLWRIFQLNKHLSRPGHLWSKFGTGNRDSLSKAARKLKDKDDIVSKANLDINGTSQGTSAVSSPTTSRIPSPSPSENEADGGAIGHETRRRVIEWWKEEYCASKMKLCIIGKESLDDLSNTTSKLFSAIPNRGKEPQIITEHPFGPDEKGTLVTVQTVMDFHALEITFPLEYQLPYWRHKPANFLSHIIGHEGPGSLHSYLKNKSWITSLSTGQQTLGRAFANFKVTVHLTESGFENYRSVISAVFKYMNMMRSLQLESFHQREISTLSNIRFRFAEKKRPDNYAVWIAEHMDWPIPPELLISGPQLTWDWEVDSAAGGGESKIREYLENFRLDQGRVVLMAKAEEHKKIRPDLTWQTEPWYGTQYNVERFDEDFVKQTQGSNDIPELFLPGPNAFIPTDLNVDKRKVTEPSKRPHMIRQTPLTTLWHKKDDRFWVPKAHVLIDLRSRLTNSSPRASVLTRVYADLVNDALTEFSYDADLAGLSYSFTSTTSGLYISMEGYNDKLAILAQDVLKKAKTFKVETGRLAVMKEQATREWRNFFLSQPYQLSDYFGRYLLTERQWTPEERLREISTVTVEEIEIHAKNIFADVHLRMLVAGNIHKDEALRIADIVEEGLHPTSMSQTELNDRALLLEQSSNSVWSIPSPNPNQPNSALSYYLHFGSVSNMRLRVTAALLSQMLSEPAFNILRTREQLGYVVFCSQWSLSGSTERGLRIVIQGEKNPGYFEQRVEAFLNEVRLQLEEMPADTFLEHKTGLQKKWLEADKNLSEETYRLWNQVSSGQWDFLRSYHSAELLSTITKEEVLELFRSHIDPSSPTRAKLSVHITSLKPRIKKVSEAALQACEDKLRASGIDPAEFNWKAALPDSPPNSVEFTQFWRDTLADRDQGTKLVEELSSLIEQNPIEGEDTNPTIPHATYIQDPKEFRSKLEASVDSGPMVHWNDLPMSKF